MKKQLSYIAAEDIRLVAALMEYNCSVIQNIDYTLSRPRQEDGHPYGSTLPTILSFTVRLESGKSYVHFFDNIKSTESRPYTIIHNPSFDANGMLVEYELAMVATGYVVDIVESYDTDINDQGQSEQMLVTVQMLLDNIAYLGNESSCDLLIHGTKIF